MWTKICGYMYLGAVVVVGLTTSAQIVNAQGYANLSCGQLWYERNRIFADYGYCFQTPQTIEAFGRGCFPPYGRLSRSAQARVNAITYWERRKGCSG
jgi:hypothetical protein